jgi:hypothetical protein
MPPEKRRSERSENFLIVEFRSFNKTTEYSLGVTNNISRDGFSLDSQIFDFKKGEIIECNLKQSDGKFSVSAIGEIVWRKASWYNCTAGIIFKEIDEDAKNRIAEFVATGKNMLPGSSFNKDGDSLMTTENREGFSSQAGVEEKDLLIKAFQRTDKDIPERDDKSDTNTDFQSFNAIDEAKNNDTIETEKTVNALASDADINVYQDKGKPSYSKPEPAHDIPVASEIKKKINRLYIPTVTVIIIAIGVVLYLRSGFLEERDNSIIPPPANPDILQHIYTAPSSVSEDENKTNTLANQKMTETARSQNALIQENKQNRLDKPLDLSTKDIYLDEPAATANVQSGQAPLQKLPETEQLPATGANNGTPEDFGTKTLIPDIPVKAGKETESVVETKAEPVLVPALQQKNIITYKDTFSDNSNNWGIFDTNMASTTIKNGEYFIQNKRKKGPYIIFNRYDLPIDLNFVSEASIRPVTNLSNYSYGLVVKTPNNRSYGFVFGAKDSLNNYTFQIRENGFYSISKYKNGSLQELANGKIKKTAYNHGGINVLKIAKKDNKMQFYINENIIDEIPDLSFFGNKAGFIVEGELIIAVDNFVTQIQ